MKKQRITFIFFASLTGPSHLLSDTNDWLLSPLCYCHALMQHTYHHVKREFNYIFTVIMNDRNILPSQVLSCAQDMFSQAIEIFNNEQRHFTFSMYDFAQSDDEDTDNETHREHVIKEIMWNAEIHLRSTAITCGRDEGRVYIPRSDIETCIRQVLFEGCGHCYDSFVLECMSASPLLHH